MSNRHALGKNRIGRRRCEADDWHWLSGLRARQRTLVVSDVLMDFVTVKLIQSCYGAY